MIRQFDFPAPVVALLAIAAAEYDTTAEVRGWGRSLLSSGVTFGKDVYVVGQVIRPIGGLQCPCVQLDIRRGYFGPESARSQESYVFPVASLRRISFECEVLG